jgi:hypothetical protein
VVPAWQGMTPDAVRSVGAWATRRPSLFLFPLFLPWLIEKEKTAGLACCFSSPSLPVLIEKVNIGCLFSKKKNKKREDVFISAHTPVVPLST